MLFNKSPNKPSKIFREKKKQEMQLKQENEKIQEHRSTKTKSADLSQDWQILVT